MALVLNQLQGTRAAELLTPLCEPDFSGEVFWNAYIHLRVTNMILSLSNAETYDDIRK